MQLPYHFSSMSDFASLLSSFQNTAAAAKATAAPTKPNSKTSRKRPPPPPSSIASPHFSPQRPPRKQRHNKPSLPLTFLIIGGQKCGTTWIHKLLQQCPALSLPKQKEVHFWDWHYRKGMDWYTRQFDRTHDDTSPRLLGEITPDYAVLPPATIAELRASFPDLKIVFVARDLVERAWSAIVMELRNRTLGYDPGEFAPGILADDDSRREPRISEKSISMAQKQRMERRSSPSLQPDSYFMERLEHETHRSRSDYAGALRNWYASFSAESILILDYREIKEDPRKLLFRIVKHVGVEEGVARKFVEGLKEAEVRQRVNASTDHANGSNMESEENGVRDSSESLSKRPLLRKRMERYLSPYAVEFNALLKEQGYSWELNEYKQQA
ncbi:hypothetical protein ACHAW6_005728 [Cyclotella cf. meneghiniana]